MEFKLYNIMTPGQYVVYKLHAIAFFSGAEESGLIYEIIATPLFVNATNDEARKPNPHGVCLKR